MIQVIVGYYLSWVKSESRWKLQDHSDPRIGWGCGNINMDLFARCGLRYTKQGSPKFQSSNNEPQTTIISY